jgi:cellulose synthase/poly-beta-1,6-N-acetylglucosamine synthase-like glycosyltransferase
MTILSWFALFWLSLCLAACAIQVFSLVTTFVFARLRPPPLPPEHRFPGVTIIKTCCGDEDNEIENFDVLFRQDYPGPLQLIFTSPSDHDPANAVVRHYLEKYPDHDAMLLISTTRKSIYRKMDAVYDAHPEVKHPLVIWSDSDTVVRPDYVTSMAATLAPEDTHLVSTPQLNIRPDNFVTGLKSVGLNADIASYVTVYHFFTANGRKVGAWGHSLGYKKSVFDSLEEELWCALTRPVADDTLMAYLFQKHGYHVKWYPIYCPVQYSGKSWGEMIRQNRRHLACQVASTGSRVRFFFGFLLAPQVSAFFYCLFSGLAPASLALFAAVMALRLLVCAVHERLILGTFRMTLTYGWTLVLWDLLQIYFYPYGALCRSVEYHGKFYRVVERYFVERDPAASDS